MLKLVSRNIYFIVNSLGGRSRRTVSDVYADILEVVKEKEDMNRLRKPLFEEGNYSCHWQI